MLHYLPKRIIDNELNYKMPNEIMCDNLKEKDKLN